MRAQELLIDNTANNLANVNTTGFKKSHVEFSDLIYDVSKAPGAPIGDGQFAPIGTQIGNGVRATGTTNVFTQGAPIEDRIDTHMAIEGDGFFRVQNVSGNLIGYTRDGSFTRNADGLLVNSAGLQLEPGITIPSTAEKLKISKSGEVSVTENGQPSVVGQIELYRFANPTGLLQNGGNLFLATEASGPEIAGNPMDIGYGRIQQGSLEGSNVEVVSEMVSLITAQRAYEINSRAIKAGDEMLSTTSQIVR
ncbi:MAG: flagellar basal-body rod protein FlgG, partial [Planctomycetaceae bacterium]|nr:flagellar basal-body rod protein FlgG [Planctomycetaceae bacterium]